MEFPDKNDPDPATGIRRTPVSITLPPQLLEAIDYLAAKQKRSRGNMIEVLCAHGLVAECSGRRFDNPQG